MVTTLNPERPVCIAVELRHFNTGSYRRTREYGIVVKYLNNLVTRHESVFVFTSERKTRQVGNGECPIFCVTALWSMLPERSKDDDDFQRDAGRIAEGLRAA